MASPGSGRTHLRLLEGLHGLNLGHGAVGALLDALRQMGANYGTGMAEAELREGKIQALRATLDEPTVEQIGAAQGADFD